MCFSPDGSYIVYSYQQKEDSPYNDIFLLSTDGGRGIPLIEHPVDDFVLGWAPDGKNILFASDRTGNFDVWVIQVADGKPQGTPKLVKADIGRRFLPLGVTQKGTFYYGIKKGSEDVYIATLDPKTGKILAPPEKAVKRFEGSNIAPYYSPDGKYLAYISRLGFLSTSPSSSRRHIHCIRSLETGKERGFTFNLNLISSSFPSWSPDCRYLLVIGQDKKYGEGIFQIDAQTGDVKLIVQSKDGIPRSLTWSRDGKDIFYVRRNHTNNLCQIMVRDLEGGTEKELYRSSSDSYGDISVSPDGKWLALHSEQSNNSLRSLKVMPVTGGEPRELYKFEKEEGFRSITWSADGKYIIFAKQPLKQNDPKGELCRIPAEGGEPEKLGLEMIRINDLSVHPDGRHIVFSSPGSSVKFPEVWVMENFLPE
jgi:Tol biopolymer transport system component